LAFCAGLGALGRQDEPAVLGPHQAALLGFEIFLVSPCFDQRTIDGELFSRKQTAVMGLRQHFRQKLWASSPSGNSKSLVKSVARYVAELSGLLIVRPSFILASSPA
jgi:hypothetical protein